MHQNNDGFVDSWKIYNKTMTSMNAIYINLHKNVM